MREIREQHNHTQEYLIENTRLHISHYENQQKFPSLETLSLFCEYYNISLHEFFKETDYPKNKQ
ncbi:helix-turn-helix transcriptional regulator [Alistipes muris]|uniref:helix-turn-helix domain-containing protein n=1 Tax=Alistipes TaxID=239759 RepID=UPI00203F8F23|nr:helix-turn-helix transcriptional regulator [Alistipes muris]MCX4282265.1 helix-turn-helix transcriptional regulator [Alistipes sp.]MDE6876667.1 helix-turn-helix transcriptional regulator [Alistipes sp.]